MLLDCPSCSAKYSVPASAIGDTGRDVRCKKCGHVWFQKPERASLDDLINKIQSQPARDDDISFEDDGAVAAAIKTTSSSLKNKANKTAKEDGFVSRMLGSITTFFPASRVAGMMVGLAVLSCILWGVMAGRMSIAHSFPSTAKIYENIGFSLSPYARVEPEHALAVDRLAWTKNHRGAGGILQGQMINLISKPVRIPKIQVLFQDKNGRILADETVILDKEGLGKEAVYPFIATISKNVPAKTQIVAVRFAE